MSLALKFGPWIALAVMVWLYLGKRDDLAAAIEQCNTDKMASVAAAERITREAVQKAANERIAQLEDMALRTSNALRIEREARTEAENRPEKVRTVYRRIVDADACAGADYNPDLLRCVRDGTDCGETRPGTGSDGL